MNGKLTTDKGRRLLLFALICAELTSPFESVMIFAALKTLIQEYGDPIRVSWLVTSFLLVGTAAAATGSRLGDMFGRRKVLLAVLVLALIGSVISAVSTSLGWIIFGRAIQGVTGCIMPLCVGLIREEIPGKKVPVWIGYLATTAGISAGLGLLVGGAIVDNLGWQSIFWASAFLALVAVIAVWQFVPSGQAENLNTGTSIDWMGLFIFLPALTGLMYFVSKIRNIDTMTGTTVLVGAVSAVLMAFFVRYSLRHSDPLLNFRLLSDRRIAVAAATMALGAASMLQLTLVMSLQLQQPVWTGIGLGVSAAMVGIVKIPSNFIGAFGSVWAGHSSIAKGTRSTLIKSVVVAAIGWLCYLLYQGSLIWVGMVAFLVLFAWSGVYAMVATIVADATPPDRTSETNGFLQIVRTMFMAIGAQLATLCLASSTVEQGTESYPSPAAFKLCLVLFLGMSIAMIGIATLLPKESSSSKNNRQQVT